jgi:superfamily II DNA helicase RecQ
LERRRWPASNRGSPAQQSSNPCPPRSSSSSSSSSSRSQRRRILHDGHLKQLDGILTRALRGLVKNFGYKEILPSQRDVLSYFLFSLRARRDVILSLPCNAGKTFISTAMAWILGGKTGGKMVVLCPLSALAMGQVADLNGAGLDAVALGGKPESGTSSDGTTYDTSVAVAKKLKASGFFALFLSPEAVVEEEDVLEAIRASKNLRLWVVEEGSMVKG